VRIALERRIALHLDRYVVGDDGLELGALPQRSV
jgi:hypothetical protein